MAAKLPDINTLIQAGINPKTGLPIRIDSDGCLLKENIRKNMRILDEQDAINRYIWYNLPGSLDGQLLERILYYKGQGAFFYMPTNGQFYFLPYALDGTIDVYGRFNAITPLPFNGSTQTNEKGKIQPWIIGMNKVPVYGQPLEITTDMMLTGCVLLHDYSKQYSETIIARQILQEPILDIMSEAFPMARTALIAHSGIKGVRVQDEDQASQVKLASKSITKAALNGNPWVPIIGTSEFQDLTDGQVLKSEEYLLYLQALDNYRLSLYGLDTGGLFQKKSHMLESEQSMNAGHAKLTYNDGLTIRQNFCDTVNAIWGLGIWCEPSESVLAADINGDGIAVDSKDPTIGEQRRTNEPENEEE